MFNVVSFIRPCEQRCTCSCLGKERHYIISQGFRITGCYDRSRYAQTSHFIIQFSFYERSDWLKFVLINTKHKTLVKHRVIEHRKCYQESHKIPLLNLQDKPY